MVISLHGSVNRGGTAPGRALCAGAALAILVVACSPALADPIGSRERHNGEILGLDREAGTLTLRSVHRDIKELAVFQVTEETVISEKGRKSGIPLQELRPGDRITVISQRREGQRVALEIRIRQRRQPETP